MEDLPELLVRGASVPSKEGARAASTERMEEDLPSTDRVRVARDHSEEDLVSVALRAARDHLETDHSLQDQIRVHPQKV